MYNKDLLRNGRANVAHTYTKYRKKTDKLSPSRPEGNGTLRKACKWR